jgi:hypothetical protein
MRKTMTDKQHFELEAVRDELEALKNRTAKVQEDLHKKLTATKSTCR